MSVTPFLGKNVGKKLCIISHPSSHERLFFAPLSEFDKAPGLPLTGDKSSGMIGQLIFSKLSQIILAIPSALTPKTLAFGRS